MLEIYKQHIGFTMLVFAICGLYGSLASAHEGKALPNGSYVFAIPPHITSILSDSRCDGQIVTDGIVRALYESGTMANSEYPVKFASVGEFTLDMCPASIHIIAECAEQKIFHNNTFVCINSRPTDSPTTFLTSAILAEPAPPSENSALRDRYHFISGTVIVLGMIFSLLLVLRKPIAHCIRKEKSPGSSAASSNNNLLIT